MQLLYEQNNLMNFVKGVAMAEVLIKHGSDVNARKPHGTPIYNAVFEERVDILKVLLENKADIHAVDAHGGQVIQVAARKKLKGYDMVKMLLEYEADVNHVDTVSKFNNLFKLPLAEMVSS